MTNSITGTTWSYTGLVVPAEKGERPKETDAKKLVETRAVQLKGGWVGQIIMAGEIVHETRPVLDNEDEHGSEVVLEEVNQHILDRFKRMIIG